MEQGAFAGIGWSELLAAMLTPIVINPSVVKYGSSLQRLVLQWVAFGDAIYWVAGSE